MKRRWLPIGLLALAIFVINAAGRFISWKAKVQDDAAQSRLSLIGVLVVGLILLVAALRWSLRFPFPRVVADLGAALLAGTLLAVIVGPFAGGSKPFAEGPEVFIDEFLLLVAVGVVAIFLGFICMVALGKDWKSRGLRRYEQNYTRKPHKPVRG